MMQLMATISRRKMVLAALYVFIFFFYLQILTIVCRNDTVPSGSSLTMQFQVQLKYHNTIVIYECNQFDIKIYSCSQTLANGKKDRFMSISPTCEGKTVDGSLGHLLTGSPLSSYCMSDC